MINMARSSIAKRLAGTFTALLLLLQVAEVYSAPPTLESAMPRGLQTGGSTLVVLRGQNLLPDPQIVAPFAIASQTVKEGATAEQVQIEVAVAGDVPPGLYQIRLATPEGISNPLVVGVDALPEVPFADQVGSLPVALHGTLTGTAVLTTRFAGMAGQQLVVEVEGRRLGVELNPVVHLYDERRVELALAQPTRSLFGDCRLVATLPADGTYTVELHDAAFRGPGPGTFRLKIGQFAFADLAYPLGVRAGTAAKLGYVATNLPRETSVEYTPPLAAGLTYAPWPSGVAASGTRPLVSVSDWDEFAEEAVTGPLPVPVGISGRLSAPAETDRFTLSVPPGQTLRLAVLASRLGSPLDGVLQVMNAAGAVLAQADDQPDSTDPVLEFTVPAGTSELVAAVHDLQGRGGPEYAYRLVVVPAGWPDFSLIIDEDRAIVPRSGVTLLRVQARRNGYNGPIRLSVPQLPSTMVLAGDEIPAGAEQALLAISAADGAPRAMIASLRGESVGTPATLVREAQAPPSLAARAQAWFSRELGLAQGPLPPLVVIWDTSPPGQTLPLGASLPVRVRVARREGVAGAVRLSLVTSQVVPKKTIQENNQAKVVDDLERALRLEGEAVLAADASEIQTQILVPGDLGSIAYDLAFRAELLGADGTTVAATAYSMPRRLVPTVPYTLELAGPPKVEAPSGMGEPGTVSGRVVRRAGFAAPVRVTLAGLPPELPPPSIEVPGTENEFTLRVAFPFNSPLGEVPNVRLQGLSPLPSGGAIASNEIPLALNVVAGGAPPPLYKLFEDEAQFASLLTEGGGQASLETTDRYSGEASLRITPDQRLRTRLPGLGVRIAEQPGEGEYRYLRFAWKKRGGTSVLVQLAANGKFGPQRGEQPGYRYEAGPQPNPLNLEAISLDEKLPDDWVLVERDLFADFGAFTLDGLAFTPLDGEYALIDHVYLARTREDFAGCPSPTPPEPPLAVFEDQPEFPAALNQGGGMAELTAEEVYSGTSALKVSPDQRFNPMLPGLGVRIRQHPGPGEYRYLRFAWKKRGGERICLQLNHDGQWGPTPENPGKFRYDAGPAFGESYGAAIRLSIMLPDEYVVVTRDLYADFGEFTLTGLALSPIDGAYALFDHIYLARSPRDFDLVKP